MYGTVKIGGKEYKLEYSFEASMYSDCVTAMITILQNMGSGDPHDIIESMGDLPRTAVTLFYAGLLEHHGIEGDNTVRNMADAKRLAKQYILEQGENGNFYTLLTLCVDQMGEDGFFKLVGLEELMSEDQTEEEIMPKPIPQPQDHKKKTRKATEK